MRTIVLIALIALVCSHSLNSEIRDFKEFQKFIKKYNKKYSSMEEFMARFVVFRQNLNEVKLTLNKVQTWTEGITQFSDLTEQEFRKTYLNLDIDALSRINYEPVQAKRVKDAPESFNWMEKESSDQSRTNNPAVPAGPFLLLETSKVCGPSKPEKIWSSQNNFWSTATRMTLDAEED